MMGLGNPRLPLSTLSTTTTSLTTTTTGDNRDEGNECLCRTMMPRHHKLDDYSNRWRLGSGRWGQVNGNNDNDTMSHRTQLRVVSSFGGGFFFLLLFLLLICYSRISSTMTTVTTTDTVSPLGIIYIYILLFLHSFILSFNYYLNHLYVGHNELSHWTATTRGMFFFWTLSLVY
jgi:hypothetical protein